MTKTKATRGPGVGDAAHPAHPAPLPARRRRGGDARHVDHAQGAAPPPRAGRGGAGRAGDRASKRFSGVSKRPSERRPGARLVLAEAAAAAPSGIRLGNGAARGLWSWRWSRNKGAGRGGRWGGEGVRQEREAGGEQDGGRLHGRRACGARRGSSGARARCGREGRFAPRVRPVRDERYG